MWRETKKIFPERFGNSLRKTVIRDETEFRAKDDVWDFG